MVFFTLLFRLEVDLLVGSWAAKNVPTLSEKQLKEFDSLLQDVETVDMYNYLLGREEPPQVRVCRVCWVGMNSLSRYKHRN